MLVCDLDLDLDLAAIHMDVLSYTPTYAILVCSRV